MMNHETTFDSILKAEAYVSARGKCVVTGKTWCIYCQTVRLLY